MSDRAAVALAAAAVAGALVARGPVWWIAGAVVAVALATRRPLVLCVAVFALAGSLGARAEAGLVSVRPGPFEGWASLRTDPEPAGTGVRADVRLDDGRHLQAVAYAGAALAELQRARAGEGVLVSGTLQRSPPGASWLKARHIVGVLAIDDVVARSPGGPWTRAANALRDVLADGADALPVRQRSLFLGFVLGDTRGQPVDITDDFRGAGLTHLLAVSGQNVAFVLVLAGPFLRRWQLRGRLIATMGVIAFFAFVTRFEPSVLRASVMAGLAATAVTLGREASSLRLLALTVAGLVVIDPFLVRNVGFQLSAGACLGITLVSPVLARTLPGPRPLVDALAVTTGAHLGVAPVLIAVFGGVPAAGLPANLLAGPAAGPVMVWGLSVGVVAGLAGGVVSTVLHFPTSLLIGWIAWVAHEMARVPAGEVHLRELLVIVGGGCVALFAHHVGFGTVRRAGVVAVLGALLAPALALRAPPPLGMQLTEGATLWRANGTVLDLDGRVREGALLQEMRRVAVDHVDLVVARSSSASLGVVIELLRTRATISEVLMPPDVTEPVARIVGALRVDVRRVAERLTVDVSVAGVEMARGPPV